jgi:methyl-accepting chemotaxis protein
VINTVDYITGSKIQSGGLFRIKILIIPFALTVILLGGIGWYIWESSKVAQKTRIQDKRIQELSGELNYLDEVLTMSARMAAATGELSWEQRYLSFQPKVDAAFNEGTQLLPQVFKSESMAEATTAATKLIAMEHRAFDLVRQGKRPAAAALLSSLEYEQQKQMYSKAMEQTIAAMKKHIEESMQAQTQQASVAVAIVILALVILVVAWSSVLKTLVSYIQTLKNVQSAISSTTVQIVSTIDQQERLATQQATAVNETTTTMDELGASSRQAAEQAELASVTARQMLELAESSATGARHVLALVEGGSQSVEQTVEGMSTIKERVGAIAEQIIHLSQQTYQIGNITNLVTDIANQTNMLSLNAAVEAARAGENGKGFSVVASEIRKLADKSKKSADQINNLINEIQNAISLTVMVSDEGKKKVEEGIKVSQKTSEAFSSVAQAINDIVLKNQEISLLSINDVVTISQQISLTSKQQAIAIQQVVDAMNNINQSAAQTASGITQTKIGTQRLNEAAENLKAVV